MHSCRIGRSPIRPGAGRSAPLRMVEAICGPSVGSTGRELEVPMSIRCSKDRKKLLSSDKKCLRGARETARPDRQNVADLDAQTSADLERANRQTTAELDRQDAAEHDRQTSADIPVSFNPVVLTPLKKEKSLTKVSMPAEFDIWWSIYPRRVRKVPSAENLHARHRNPTSHYLRTTVRRGALCCRTAKPRSAVHQASCNLAEPRMLAGEFPQRDHANPKTTSRADSAIDGMRGFLEDPNT